MMRLPRVLGDRPRQVLLVEPAIPVPELAPALPVAGFNFAYRCVHPIIPEFAEMENTTMAKQIDYCLTPASPWAYLGHARFAAMA